MELGEPGSDLGSLSSGHLDLRSDHAEQTVERLARAPGVRGLGTASPSRGCSSPGWSAISLVDGYGCAEGLALRVLDPGDLLET